MLYEEVLREERKKVSYDIITKLVNKQNKSWITNTRPVNKVSKEEEVALLKIIHDGSIFKPWNNTPALICQDDDTWHSLIWMCLDHKFHSAADSFIIAVGDRFLIVSIDDIFYTPDYAKTIKKSRDKKTTK